MWELFDDPYNYISVRDVMWWRTRNLSGDDFTPPYNKPFCILLCVSLQFPLSFFCVLVRTFYKKEDCGGVFKNREEITGSHVYVTPENRWSIDGFVISVKTRLS